MPPSSPIFKAHWGSPLGPMLLAASPAGLRGLWFLGQKHFPVEADSWIASPEPFRETLAWLADYFAASHRPFSGALDLSQGTPFQQGVWQRLRAIPMGETTTYGAIAAHLGTPAASRAVGAAVGRNPVSIIVPCHRVLGASGSLTGYAGGLDRKSRLLSLELRLPDARRS